MQEVHAKQRGKAKLQEEGSLKKQQKWSSPTLLCYFHFRLTQTVTKTPVFYIRFNILFISLHQSRKKKNAWPSMKLLTGSQTSPHIFSDTKRYPGPGAVDRAAEQGLIRGLSSGGQGCRLMHKTQKILIANLT